MNAKKRSTKKLTIKESYSDIWSDNAWDAYDIALEYLGAEGLCEALAKAMGTDALADNLKYIFRTNEIPFNEDEDEEYDESLKRPVREVIDIDADGYERVSGRPGYHLYRKDLRDENGKVIKGVWAAQKYDAMKGQTVGEPFEITYDQARGFEPIEDTVASRLGKKVGKALGFPIRRESCGLKKKGKRSMKEAYGDTKYEARQYYDADFRGLADDLFTDDFSELEDWLWDMVAEGPCEVVNSETGNRARLILPDDDGDYQVDDCIYWSDKYGKGYENNTYSLYDTLE